MDSEVRTAQLILKGTLHEMDLADQIYIEEAIQALRQVGFNYASVIEFATSLYAMELSQLANEQAKVKPPADKSLKIHVPS